MIDPFTGEGTWLRCALHAHTTESDGDLPPAALAAHYARAGYDVLAITDHWRITPEPEHGPILVVPGVELNCELPGARDGHVLGYGLAAEPEELRELAGTYADLAATGDWIVAHGGVAYLAHPYWTGVTAGTLELPSSVTGIEVFNTGCELEVGRGLSTVHWDELAESGTLCPALATDDSHHPGFDSDHAWTWLRAEAATVDAVLDALRSGSFYGSQGPMFEAVRRDGDAIDVACSPCRSVILVSGRTTGAAVHAGRLGYRHAGTITATGRRPRHRRPPHDPSRRRPRAGRARRRARAEGMVEPVRGLSREQRLERLAETGFDLLVVGGGIIGAGIAAHAARTGLSVALVDAGDFAGGTSSASSKLVHGGLRYLRLGDVRLVREAHHERRVLSNVVAPHLVHRQPFLLPLYENGPVPSLVRPERDRGVLDARALPAQLARRA